MISLSDIHAGYILEWGMAKLVFRFVFIYLVSKKKKKKEKKPFTPITLGILTM